MKLISSVAVLILFCEISHGSRILFLFPIHSKSHLIIVQGLASTLANKGHEVTVVSPYPLSKPMKNYRDIQIQLTEDEKNMASDMVKNPNKSMFWTFPNFMNTLFGLAETMLDMEEFKKIIAEESFDLLFIGQFMNNFLLGVGEQLNCPTMILSVNAPMVQNHHLFGNPLGVSAVPHLFLQTSTPFSFIGRTKAFLAYGLELLFKMYMDSVQKAVYR